MRPATFRAIPIDWLERVTEIVTAPDGERHFSAPTTRWGVAADDPLAARTIFFLFRRKSGFAGMGLQLPVAEERAWGNPIRWHECCCPHTPSVESPFLVRELGETAAKACIEQGLDHSSVITAKG
jgi:hypothetical protein